MTRALLCANSAGTRITQPCATGVRCACTFPLDRLGGLVVGTNNLRVYMGCLGWAALGCHCRGRDRLRQGKRPTSSPFLLYVSTTRPVGLFHCSPSLPGRHRGRTMASPTSLAVAPIPSADNVASDPETDVPDLRITYEPQERTSGAASKEPRERRGTDGAACAAFACTHAWQRTRERESRLPAGREGCPCRASVRAHADAEAAGARSHGHARSILLVY